MSDIRFTAISGSGSMRKTHSRLKTGQIKTIDYDDQKYFTHETIVLNDFGELADFLDMVQHEADTCMVMGGVKERDLRAIIKPIKTIIYIINEMASTCA